EDHRRPLAILLATVSLVGIVLAMHGPPGSWLRLLPPLDRIRYPSKALTVSVFGVAMLAGIGIDSLRFAPTDKRERALFGVLSVIALALAAASPPPFVVRLAAGAASAALGLLALGAGGRRPIGSLLAAVGALGLVGGLAW